MPAIDLPFGAEVEEAMCVAFGGLDIYDFHALETIQCMVERRRGGETGVAAVQAFRGESVWKAIADGRWGKGLGPLSKRAWLAARRSPKAPPSATATRRLHR